ncbi:MAG: hypothetical protein WHW07_04940 [Bacteroidales bacterium]|jgi:hypothetical protein|nr:hypothetical protein [Bacteroidales bacterium]HOL97453.1 hypothetical protein [Bacteroidales bacterium]HOM36027.1 hypothetical protein [Bacteroidales bacterium]HPD23337.1 hypothetical protein [Bacteroidales bacterium]HRS99727.1 hypothetical protein [Bacteroidales bacterium]
MKKIFLFLNFYFGLLIFTSQNIQVEVTNKYPFFVSLSSKFFYFCGGFVPGFDLQYQQNFLTNSSFIILGLGNFSIPFFNAQTTSMQYRFDYKNIFYNNDKTKCNSFAFYLGKKFHSDKFFSKYSFFSRSGEEFIYINDDVAIKPDVALGFSLGMPLSDSRILFEVAYHPIKKVVGDYILKSYYSLNLLWLLYMPEHEKWTTNY